MIRKMVEIRYPGTEYRYHVYADGILFLDIASTNKTAVCPYCGYPSAKVHSYHTRKFADLPYNGHELSVNLRIRKFFCSNENCAQKTFAEQFSFIKPSEKKTTRLIEKIISVYDGASSRKATTALNAAGVRVCKATVCNLKSKYR